MATRCSHYPELSHGVMYSAPSTCTEPDLSRNEPINLTQRLVKKRHPHAMFAETSSGWLLTLVCRAGQRRGWCRRI